MSAIVVGAGLSGLACAFELARRGVPVRVLEASPRAGGVMGSVRRDGFLFESGPNTVQATAAEFVRLCDDLGLRERFCISRASAGERYLWHRGRLTPVPSNPLALATTRLLSPAAKLAVLTEPLRRFRASGDRELTLEEFLVDRIGAEATRLLAGAFVRGVYAAELADLGAQSAFPKLWRWAVEHGGLVRGLAAERRKKVPTTPAPPGTAHSLLSFPDGFQELVDALARALGARLLLDSPVSKIARSAEKWSVVLRTGDVLHADHVVLAVPAPVALRFLSELMPAGSGLEGLRRIRHACVTLVNFGMAASELASLPRGFGFLVPPAEDAPDSAGPALLGTIFTSNVFTGRAPEGCHAMTSFYTSGDRAGDASMASMDWGARACQDLARVLKSSRVPRPRIVHTQSWRDVIPRYAPGHAQRMNELAAELRASLPGLHLCASYIGGVSVDRVIENARNVGSSLSTSGA